MKFGTLFFFHMGRITMGARIALLPLIYLTFFQVRPLGVAFFTCLVLLVISAILSLIPAPSDRTARRTLNTFLEEHRQSMLDRCGFVNDGSLLLVYGYEETRDMWMNRSLEREVIYPHSVALGFVSHLGKGRLLIGKKSLLKPLPAEYLFWQDESLSEVTLSVTVDPENETVAKLCLSHPSIEAPLVFYTKNDFRVRDLADALAEIAPQSRSNG